MQIGTEKIIEYVKIYKCGYCINDEKSIYKSSRKSNKVKFYANVLIIKHKYKGLILIDTGYSNKVFDNGIVSSIYNILNPTTIIDEDNIINKLKEDNISKEDINTVILSHLHPDHIGALDSFKESTVYISEKCKDLLSKKASTPLVFKNMIPDNIKKVEIVEECKKITYEKLSKYFTTVYDMFSDESILFIDLPGHAVGQIGVYIKDIDLLFIADATWSTSKISEEIKFIPRLIQHSYKYFIKTNDIIIRFMNDNKSTKVIASHDDVTEGIIC